MVCLNKITYFEKNPKKCLHNTLRQLFSVGTTCKFRTAGEITHPRPFPC